ncbi:MAG TPA: GNAT family N-acetyltransferase [Chloroflexota bacterium]|nr:GNAT family N-acetyltransferase [Chloroflexota bacterium]HUM67526.1 GNAT family N-acetyltransferase [Chloroflexota bacterium]
MNIRPFRYTDLEPLMEIAKLSFAEEYGARGQTPDSFVRQIRMAARGRMIPFRILSALAGIQWALFVAEVNSRVVGCGGYLGRKQMELSNLMVHPDYRRRGIGQALLEKRLEALAEKGFPLVITTILASNQASLGNVAKQGFEAFDRYTFWESALPLKSDSPATAVPFVSRPVQPADTATFKALEAQIANPIWLQIRGSAAPNYFSPWGERLLNRFANTARWSQVFINGETIVGFLATTTSSDQTKGVLARPVVADDNLECLLPMLAEAATRLTQMDKTAVQMAVPDERQQLAAQLEGTGWTKRESWVQLVKWLK